MWISNILNLDVLSKSVIRLPVVEELRVNLKHLRD